MDEITNGKLANRARKLPGAALLGGAFGRLFMGPGYLATLDTDTLLRRGLGEARAREFIEGDRDRRTRHGQATESFLQGAEAHAGILGERHRDSVECNAIHGVLSEARQIDLDQRELLHPAPQHVADIHRMKTPDASLET